MGTCGCGPLTIYPDDRSRCKVSDAVEQPDDPRHRRLACQFGKLD